MGSCVFQIHYHNEKQKQISNTPSSSETNEFFNLISEKEKHIKNSFNNTINQLGKFIRLKEYEELVSDNIRSYISDNKLDYKKYLPKDLVTYKAFPIQFKNNNNIYYGNWNENQEMEGYGIYYLNEEKVVTEGIWLKGNIIFGRIFFQNGNIYEGKMKNSLPHGKGKIIFHNGERYEGDFEMGEMTGFGTFFFSDKTKYEGDIKNGIFNGKGQMKWKYGVEYQGDFVDSSLCGKGKIFNNQGEEYEGNFDKNEFNGEGIYLFNNGDKYEGNFEYGIKKGKGKYTRNDNIIFEGFWNNDLPNGSGIIYYKKMKFKGFWRNGNLVGNLENEEGSNRDIDNIDMNIRPSQSNINPSSLPHLETFENSVSQFIQNNEINFD